MVTGVLFLMLVLLAALLTAFIYEIATTPLTAVDAPTLVRAAAASSAAAPSAAAPSAPARALPVRQPRARTVPAATGPARGAAAPGPPRRRSRSTAVLGIGGLAAVVVGGWLFLRIAHGAAACSRQAIEVCSQGYVLLTGTQLAGAAIATVGTCSIVIAIALAMRAPRGTPETRWD
jgi:hypothetical protein